MTGNPDPINRPIIPAAPDVDAAADALLQACGQTEPDRTRAAIRALEAINRVYERARRRRSTPIDVHLPARNEAPNYGEAEHR